MSKNRIIKVVLIGVLIIVLVVSSRSQIGDDGQSGYNEDDDGDGDGDGSNFDLQNLEPGLQGPQESTNTNIPHLLDEYDTQDGNMFQDLSTPSKKRLHARVRFYADISHFEGESLKLLFYEVGTGKKNIEKFSDQFWDLLFPEQHGPLGFSPEEIALFQNSIKLGHRLEYVVSMFFYWLGFTFEDFLLGKLKSNSNLQVDETVKRLGSVMWIIKRIISTLELLGMPSVAYGLARYLSLIIYRKECAAKQLKGLSEARDIEQIYLRLMNEFPQQPECQYLLRLRSKTNRESVEGRPTEADIKYEETFINKQRKSKKTKRLKGGLADYKRISFSEAKLKKQFKQYFEIEEEDEPTLRTRLPHGYHYPPDYVPEDVNGILIRAYEDRNYFETHMREVKSIFPQTAIDVEICWKMERGLEMVQAGYDMVLENVGLEIINEEGDMGVNVLSAHLLTNIAQPVYQDLVETVISSMERLGLGRSTKSLKQYLGKVKNLKKAPTENQVINWEFEVTDDELDEMLQGAAGGTKKKVKKRIQSAGTPRPYGPSRHQYPKVQANYQDQFRFKVDKEQEKRDVVNRPIRDKVRQKQEARGENPNQQRDQDNRPGPSGLS